MRFLFSVKLNRFVLLFFFVFVGVIYAKVIPINFTFVDHSHNCQRNYCNSNSISYLYLYAPYRFKILNVSFRARSAGDNGICGFVRGKISRNNIYYYFGASRLWSSNYYTKKYDCTDWQSAVDAKNITVTKNSNAGTYVTKIYSWDEVWGYYNPTYDISDIRATIVTTDEYTSPEQVGNVKVGEEPLFKVTAYTDSIYDGICNYSALPADHKEIINITNYAGNLVNYTNGTDWLAYNCNLTKGNYTIYFRMPAPTKTENYFQNTSRISNTSIQYLKGYTSIINPGSLGIKNIRAHIDCIPNFTCSADTVIIQQIGAFSSATSPWIDAFGDAIDTEQENKWTLNSSKSNTSYQYIYGGRLKLTNKLNINFTNINLSKSDFSCPNGFVCSPDLTPINIAALNYNYSSNQTAEGNGIIENGEWQTDRNYNSNEDIQYIKKDITIQNILPVNFSNLEFNESAPSPNFTCNNCAFSLDLAANSDAEHRVTAFGDDVVTKCFGESVCSLGGKCIEVEYKTSIPQHIQFNASVNWGYKNRKIYKCKYFSEQECSPEEANRWQLISQEGDEQVNWQENKVIFEANASNSFYLLTGETENSPSPTPSPTPNATITPSPTPDENDTTVEGDDWNSTNSSNESGGGSINAPNDTDEGEEEISVWENGEPAEGNVTLISPTGKEYSRQLVNGKFKFFFDEPGDWTIKYKNLSKTVHVRRKKLGLPTPIKLKPKTESGFASAFLSPVQLGLILAILLGAIFGAYKYIYAVVSVKKELKNNKIYLTVTNRKGTLKNIELIDFVPEDAKVSEFSETPEQKETVLGRMLKWKRKELKRSKWQVSYKVEIGENKKFRRAEIKGEDENKNSISIMSNEIKLN